MTQTTQNFPNNPLRRYKPLGDLLVSAPINNILSIYIVGNEKTVFYIWLWSVNHFISGILTVYLLRYYTDLNTEERYMAGFLLHTLWELFQIAVENSELTNLRGQIDIVMDTLLFMLGMILVEEYDKYDKYDKNEN